MKTILKFILLGGVIWLAADQFSGIAVSSFEYAIFTAVVLAIINVFVKPLLHIISLPITILTLGLFSFVINALIIMLLDNVMTGFSVASFWWALIFSVLISFANTLIDSLVGNK